MDLKPEHRVFAENYVIAWNAYKSLRLANIRLKLSNPKKYYVYMLTEVDSGNVFYVGKGKGNRMNQHLLNYKKSGGNEIKKERIRHIINIGGQIDCIVLKDGLSENNAFKLERIMIQRLPNLTNIHGGIFTQKEKDISSAKNVLSRMIKPCELFIIKKRHFPLWSDFYSTYVQNVVELKKVIYQN